MSRKQGTVVRWDDARGFGFIRSATSISDVFFHVRDFRGAHTDGPRLGLAVTFEEIHVGGKGPRGMSVQPAGFARELPNSRSVNTRPVQSHRQPAASAQAGSGAFFALPLMLGYAIALGWGVWMRYLPWWVLPALLLVSLLTFFAYWQDKYAAGKNQWRISESSLHFWSLAGGWPGAWMAQQVLRHKSRKQSFRETFWGTVVLHCAALGGWLWWSSRGLPG